MIIRVFIFCSQELFPFTAEKLQTARLRAMTSESCGQVTMWCGKLSGEDEKFAQGVVDHHRGENVAGKGPGGENVEAADEPAHEKSAEDDGNSGDGVEKQNLNEEGVPSALKNPQHIGNVSHHVGDEKGCKIAQHGVAGTGFIIHPGGIQTKIFDSKIFGLQGRKELPAGQMEDNNMNGGRKTTGESIFEELDKRGVV